MEMPGQRTRLASATSVSRLRSAATYTRSALSAVTPLTIPVAPVGSTALRSTRLQSEAKVEAQRHEAELAMLVRSADATTFQVRAMLGFPLLPRVKVRYLKTAKQPPAEWRQ